LSYGKHVFLLQPLLVVFLKLAALDIQCVCARLQRGFNASSLNFQHFFCQVRVFEFTEDTPMADQLRAMRDTTILVSPHTSALANAVFLPPGAAVIELIQRNWVWDNLDRSFQVQTASLGDIHHWAWRATKREHIRYVNPRDAERFGGEEWANEKVRGKKVVSYKFLF